MAKVTVSFTLDSKEDAKIARWLDQQPKRGRSKAIREALTAYLEGREVVELGHVYGAILQVSGEVGEVSERTRALAGGVTLGELAHAVSDVQRAVTDLERKVRAGVIVADGDAEANEPGLTPELEEAYANLGTLAELGS